MTFECNCCNDCVHGLDPSWCRFGFERTIESSDECLHHESVDEHMDRYCKALINMDKIDLIILCMNLHMAMIANIGMDPNEYGDLCQDDSEAEE